MARKPSKSSKKEPKAVSISGAATLAYANHLRKWSGWPNATLVWGRPSEASPYARTEHTTRTFTINADLLVRNPNRVVRNVTPFRLRQEAIMTGCMLHEAGHAQFTHWVPRTEEGWAEWKHSDGSPVEQTTAAFARVFEEPRVEARMAQTAQARGIAGLEWTMRASAAQLLPVTEVSVDPAQGLMDMIVSWAVRAGRQLALERLTTYTAKQWAHDFSDMLEAAIMNHLIALGVDHYRANDDALDVMEKLVAMVSAGFRADEGAYMVDTARDALSILFPETDQDDMPQPGAGAGACSVAGDPSDSGDSGDSGDSDDSDDADKQDASSGAGSGSGQESAEDDSEGSEDGAGGSGQGAEGGSGSGSGSDEDGDEDSDEDGTGSGAGSDEDGDEDSDDSDSAAEAALNQQADRATQIEDIENTAKDYGSDPSDMDVTLDEDSDPDDGGNGSSNGGSSDNNGSPTGDQQSGQGAGSGDFDRGILNGMDGWRPPVLADREEQRHAERFLRSMLDPTETTKLMLTDSPSSIIDGAALSAWKAAGGGRDPRFFRHAQRTVQPTPPVKIAILVDVSMSMEVMQYPSARLSWALASAALDLQNFAGRGRQVESCLIHWGSYARVIQHVGQLTPGLREFPCKEYTEVKHEAYQLIEKEMPGFFNLPEPGHESNRLIVTFTDWELGGYSERTLLPWMHRAQAAGVNTLSVVPAPGRFGGYNQSRSRLPWIEDQLSRSMAPVRGKHSMVGYDPTKPDAVWTEAAKLLGL